MTSSACFKRLFARGLRAHNIQNLLAIEAIALDYPVLFVFLHRSQLLRLFVLALAIFRTRLVEVQRTSDNFLEHSGQQLRMPDESVDEGSFSSCCLASGSLNTCSRIFLSIHRAIRSNERDTKRVLNRWDGRAAGYC